MKDIRQPPLNNARDRRLEEGEFQGLLNATAQSRNTYLEPIIRLAVETGLRRGELIALEWSCIELE